MKNIILYIIIGLLVVVSIFNFIYDREQQRKIDILHEVDLVQNDINMLMLERINLK